MEPIKYCLYARKSSESDERQALSIDWQINDMIEKIWKDWITISWTHIESHSAKEVWQRPVFNKMIREIEAWLYNWIVTWAPDRLSRNAWDLWSLVDLMDKWKLHNIITNWQNFRNTPNEKFLLMILCSQAKLENDNKWVNVVRWLKNKAETWIRPWIAPLWYLNKKSYYRNWGKIIIDPERSHIIKEVFEKVAYEWYKWREIFKRINEDIWLKTRWWKAITLSWIYRLLNDTFYYWKFEYPKGSWNWYDWDYEPIITEELFNLTQQQLNIWVRYRKRNKVFNFTRIMKCWNCWSWITAHEKYKILQNWKILSYIYYNCTKAKDHSCKEKMVEENNLVQQFIKIIDKLNISKTNISETLKNEIDRYYNFQQLYNIKVKKNNNIIKEVWIKDYMKYLLREWNRDEKREVLSYIKNKLVIKDKKVLLK